MDRTIIELMDDMHLSSQSTFLDYYYAMQSRNISYANSIILNNPSLQNQIMNAQNINYLINGVNARELEPKEDIDYFLNDLYDDFLEMIDNTRVKGEFDSTIQYYAHNLVYYNGKGYYALQNPPIGTLPTNTEYWLEYDIRGFKGYGGIDLNFKFNWDSTQAYQVGDVVIYQNKMWYALADNVNYEPNLNHYPWVIISMPKLPNKTPIQRATPSGYDTGDFWFQIISGDEIITTTWDIKTPEATPRFASSAFEIGNNIYVVDGIQGNFSRGNLTEAYDTTTNTWSVKAAAPTTRARAVGFSIGTKGYIVGGQDTNGNILDTVEIYDSETNTWSTGTSYPIPIISTAAGVYNNIAYVIGGETTNNVVVGNSYSFNPSTDTWTAITNKPTLTYGHTVAVNEGLIYVIGGLTEDEETLNINEIYNISTGTWSTGAGLLEARSFAGSFVQSGKIHVIGGLNSNWYSMNTNEKYDITTNTWTTDMPMNYSRSSLNTAFVDRHGYAIGGINIGISEVAGYMEQYNPTDYVNSFEMIVNTALGTNTISIPMVQGGTYSYWVDWGDGTVSNDITTYGDTNATHTYVSSGQYTIKLIGTLSQLQFNTNPNTATCLTEVTKCILNLENIDNMFKDCINLSSIPTGIFDLSLNITSANSTFQNCSSLNIIPVGLFDNNISITTFNNTFDNSAITSIPTALFNSNNLALSFNSTFKNCTHLLVIPTNLFRNNSMVTDFSYVFYGDTSLTEIPSNLFSGNPEVINYSYIFGNCTGIEDIPSNLFNENAVSAENFEGAFSGMSIGALPEGLFSSASSATNYNGVFNNNATNITYLPNNLFNGDNATYMNGFTPSIIIHVGNNALNGLALASDLFKNNTVLTTVGENAFWANNVVSVANTPTELLRGCTALTSVGNINLKGVSSSTDLTNMFDGCTSLTTLTGFFYTSDNTPSLACNIDFSDSPLTYNSLINIKNSLVTNTSSTIKTLTLGSINLAKLSAVEKLEIINKYWNLTGYNPATDLATGTTTTVPQLVQTLYGDTNTSSSLERTTSLYYYVRVYETANVSNTIGMYAVDQTTGIVYSYSNIPIKEYIIYAGTNSEEGETVYVSKTATNDPNGTIFKSELDTLMQSSLTNRYIEIGDNTAYAQYFPYSGLENIVNATELFADRTTLRTISIKGNFSPTNMKGMFKDTDGIGYLNSVSCTDINGNVSLDTSNCTDMSEMFYLCTNLRDISSFITSSSNLNNVTTMNSMFYGNAFTNWSFLNNWQTSHVQNMGSMFYDSTITSMPTFSMAAVTDASWMFWSSGLTSVTGNIIGSNLQNAEGMFAKCENLTTLPANYTTIFGTNNNLTNVSQLFGGCINLANVGEAPYDTVQGEYNYEYTFNTTKARNQILGGCPNITIADHILSNTAITEIPLGFFYNNPNLTDISYAFAGCESLKTASINYAVDTNFFINNSRLTTIEGLFYGCTALNTGMETNGMLSNLTAVENASYLYAGCTTLDEVQGTLELPQNSVIKNINHAFDGWQGSSYPGIFNSDPSSISTAFPALETCEGLFARAVNLGQYSSWGLNVYAQPLINQFNSISTFTSGKGAFYNCTKLSDYSSIPSVWKQQV